MKTTLELFSSAWAQALAWTLLHTIWQAGIITLLVITTLRFIPSRLARTRYGIATSALILMALLSVGTFLFLTTSTASPEVSASQNISINKPVSPVAISTLRPFDNNYLLLAQSYVQSYIPLIIVLWLMGAFLSSIRVAGGWLYIIKLKEESTLLDNEWSICVKELAHKLNIDRIVTLATSTHIQTPIVFGYIKPVILIPVGMLSGLSSEQLEAIFIHELTHIKRHDYIVNVFQSWIEALFFFNPFVWIISAIIRREREFCCDDAVITTHGNPIAYAKALAHLEEVRLTHSTLALSLAENKNQLLTRIRRIMEKSVKNYSGRERIIPAILLVAGLLCASWLTISTGRHESKLSSDEQRIASDTTSKKKERATRYSRTQTTTVNKDGEPIEKIKEEFEGDEELRPLAEMNFDNSFDARFVPPLPPLPDFDVSLAPFAFMDSIPAPLPPGHDQHWEVFAEEFEKKFKENFSDFYASHQTDFTKMMNDLEKNLTIGMEEEARAQRMQAEMHREEMRQQRHRMMEHKEEAMHQHEKAMEMLKRDHEQQAENMERWQNEHAEQFRKMESQMKEMEANMKRFENELKEELVRDGYIKADEKVKSINWTEDGTIEVNGKKIKDSDHKKYEALHRKYFKEVGGNFHYTE